MTHDKSTLLRMARINAHFEDTLNKVLNEPEDRTARQNLAEFACFMYDKLCEDYNSTMVEIITQCYTE